MRIRVTSACAVPIGINLRPGGKRYILLCDVMFQIGVWSILIKAGYEFVADEKYVEGYVGGPISDSFGARLAVRYSDMKGYLHNNARSGPIEFNGDELPGVAPWRREAMYVAVRAYSRLSGKDWTFAQSA